MLRQFKAAQHPHSTPEPTTATAPTATITATVTAEATAVAVAVRNDYADLRAEIEQKLNDGLYDDALDQTSAALAADPQNYYLQVLYATVLVRYREDGDKLEQAKQIAETAIDNHPDRPGSLCGDGGLLRVDRRSRMPLKPLII
ncbi:MAG: hypothetical protein U0528_00920 [Anaerolineae bacterium]